MGGTLSADNKRNQGALFTIILPVTQNNPV
jgi:signal transduction histidine kinase